VWGRGGGTKILNIFVRGRGEGEEKEERRNKK
jgi:hypothetical protein